MTKTCIICNEEITAANDSREHIIPRAIGGRSKTRGFLCAGCNTKCGRSWDAEAARQLNALALFFGISREGGDPPSMRVKTVSGQELFLGPGGRLTPVKPTITETQTPEGTRYNVAARSEEEARSILKGLKRKHPQIDVEAHLKTAQSVWSEPDGPIMLSLTFGGEASGRSIVKTAAAFAHRIGLDHRTFEQARSYLHLEKMEAPFGYYHERDLVQGRPDGVPIHCVATNGNPNTGLLLGYVEYYGFQRCVVCLSENYDGPYVNRAYAIDPLTGKRVNVKIDLAFTRADLRDIYAYARLPNEAMRSALANVMPTGLKRQHEAEQQRQLKIAFDYAWANCGATPGEMLTQEHLRKLSALLTDKLSPYLMRQIVAAQRARRAELRLDEAPPPAP